MEGKNFGVEKGAEKSLGRGRGCVFDSSSKRLERPHLKLVHWWLLDHPAVKNVTKMKLESKCGEFFVNFLEI